MTGIAGIIESASNEKIKAAAKLAVSSKERREKNRFLLEGLRLCRDAAECGVSVETFFYTQNAFEKHETDVRFISSKAEKTFMISKAVALKLGDTQTPQGFFCVCACLSAQNEEEILESGKFIALENVQDPSNLGAIARTAEALGITALIAENGCDIYNPKAQRAAMGSLLRLPVVKTDNLCELIEKSKKRGFKAYATTPLESAKPITEADMSGCVIAVIGNEGNGVSKRIFDSCESVTIPMKGRAESLNASVAAALVIWELMR